VLHKSEQVARQCQHDHVQAQPFDLQLGEQLCKVKLAYTVTACSHSCAKDFEGETILSDETVLKVHAVPCMSTVQAVTTADSLLCAWFCCSTNKGSAVPEA